MEDTNCGEECCFVKQGFCRTDKECPFYCESIWQLRGGTEIKTVKNCFPKRSTMETDNLNYRMACLQEIQQDLKNRMERIETTLNALLEHSREVMNSERSKKEMIEKIKSSLDIVPENNRIEGS